MKYNIGDKVWMAGITRYSTEHVVCPDCQGDKYLTVIMGDGSIIEMPCSLCEKRDKYSYDEYSRGYIEIHTCKDEVKQGTITGIEVRVDTGTEYRVSIGTSTYCPKEAKLFDTEEEAIEESKKIAEEKRLKDIHDIEKKKHNSKRTWAWNVRYHKKEIERCKKSLEHHEMKLYFARQNDRTETTK